MSNQPESLPPNRDQSAESQASSAETEQKVAPQETPEEKKESRARRIKIGSQRDTRPVSAMKPVPPPLELGPARKEAPDDKQQQEQPPQAPAQQPPQAPAQQPAADAPEAKREEVSQPADDAGERQKEEKGKERSFSELAGGESSDLARAVTDALRKKEPPPDLSADAPSTSKTSPTTDDTEADAVAEAVEVPEVPGSLSADLEQEIEAALEGVSLDEILSGEEKSTEKAGEQIAPETRMKGTVLKVDREYVFFALGGRNEGAANLRQFQEPPSPGDVMDVIVQRFDPEEGLYDVLVPGASVEVGDWSDIEEGIVVEVRVTGHNSGGLECEVNHIRGFIPISQISLYRIESDALADYVDKKLACVVTEASPQRRNLVLSHRAMLEREQEANRKQFFENLEVGQVYEGTVRKLMDFGAFVELQPGIDGLIHISQLSWDRVNHPSDVLEERQKVQVKIEKVDADTGKIGLSYRELQDNPWNNVDRKYPPGAVVAGTVSRIANFGAFVKLEPGVEGLVHISELAHYRVQRVGNVVKEGQDVEVKVLEVDPHAQRISLSMKEAQQAPEEGKPQADQDETPEPPREMAVPEHKGALKGGTNKKTGGEKFGLKW